METPAGVLRPPEAANAGTTVRANIAAMTTINATNRLIVASLLSGYSLGATLPDGRAAPREWAIPPRAC